MVRVSCMYVKSLLYALYYVGIVCSFNSRLYYAIWTFHVLSIYVFLSHLLFLCVYSLPLSLLLSNCNCNYARERERSKYMLNDPVPSNCVLSSFSHTHTPSTWRNAGSSLQCVLVFIITNDFMLRQVAS